MPVTPLHYWPAYLLKKAYNKFDMFSLVAGAYIPDLEVLFLTLLNSKISRLLLHSLFGAVLFAPLIGLIVIRPFFKAIKRDCSPKIIAVSVSAGAVTHVILDIFAHAVNPVLFPFSNESVYYFFFGNLLSSTAFVYFASIVFILSIFSYEFFIRKNIYKTLHYMLFGD